jgi:hypothetical protein
MTTSGLTLAILSLVPVTRGRSHMAILNTYMLCFKSIPPIYSAVEPETKTLILIEAALRCVARTKVKINVVH